MKHSTAPFFDIITTAMLQSLSIMQTNSKHYHLIDFQPNFYAFFIDLHARIHHYTLHLVYHSLIDSKRTSDKG